MPATPALLVLLAATVRAEASAPLWATVTVTTGSPVLPTAPER